MKVRSRRAEETKCRFCGKSTLTQLPEHEVINAAITWDRIQVLHGGETLMELHFTCLPKMVDKLKRLEGRIKKKKKKKEGGKVREGK